MVNASKSLIIVRDVDFEEIYFAKEAFRYQFSLQKPGMPRELPSGEREAGGEKC